MAGTAPQDRLSLPPRTPDFLHHFEAQKGARHCLIAFTGRKTDPASMGNPRWVYLPRMATLPVHRLYVETQVGVLPDRMVDLPALVAFVAAAAAGIGVPLERIITCGSSLGGAAALLVAAELGFGHAVVGAPSVYFGRFVRDSPAFSDESDRQAALQRWGDTLESLDSVVFDALAGARGPLHVDMLIGDADPRHPETTEALAKVCTRTPAVTLRTTIVPDVDHSALARPFGRYLSDRVLEIVAADATAETARLLERCLALLPAEHPARDAARAVAAEGRAAVLHHLRMAEEAQWSAGERERSLAVAVQRAELRSQTALKTATERRSEAARATVLLARERERTAGELRRAADATGRARRDLDRARQDLDRTRRDLQRLRMSLSWRATAPLRRIRGLAGRPVRARTRG